MAEHGGKLHTSQDAKCVCEHGRHVYRLGRSLGSSAIDGHETGMGGLTAPGEMIAAAVSKVSVRRISPY
jgi:hypothetical protein